MTPKNRQYAHGTGAALIGVGILIIWILLGGAYAWSVWNLARMVRSRDSGASPVASLPSSEVQQIELVHRVRRRAAARLRPNCGSLGRSLRSRGDHMIDVVSNRSASSGSTLRPSSTSRG